MIVLPSARARLASVPFLFRAHACLDDFGLYALSYGQRVYATFARAGTAELLDQDGRPMLMPSGMPRVASQWNGTARVPALLLERAGTGAWSYTNDIANAAWSKSSAATGGLVTGPSGAATARQLAESASTNPHYIWRDLTISGSLPASIVLDVRSAGRPLIKIYVADQSSQANKLEARANLTTGVLTLVQATGTGSGAVGTIEPLGNGFWRIHLFGIPAAGATVLRCYLIMTENGSTDSYTGNGSSGLHVDHFSFESAPVPSSPIVGGASAGSRAAESCHFPVLLPPSDCTAYCATIERGTAYLSDADHRWWTLSDATAPWLMVRYAGSRQLLAGYDNGPTAEVTSTAAQILTLRDLVESRVRLTSGAALTARVRVNGGPEVAGSTTTGGALPAAWGAARLYLGSPNASEMGLSAFRAHCIAPGNMETDALRDLCELG